MTIPNTNNIITNNNDNNLVIERAIAVFYTDEKTPYILVVYFENKSTKYVDGEKQMLVFSEKKHIEILSKYITHIYKFVYDYRDIQQQIWQYLVSRGLDVNSMITKPFELNTLNTTNMTVRDNNLMIQNKRLEVKKKIYGNFYKYTRNKQEKRNKRRNEAKRKSKRKKDQINNE